LLAAENLKKAFDLRDGVGAKEKLIIEAHYYVIGQGDLLAGIKAFQLWADTYPHDWSPWLGMADSYTQLGQYGLSIAAGQHAVQLDGTPVCYIVLARAYKNANRYAEARRPRQRPCVEVRTQPYCTGYCMKSPSTNTMLRHWRAKTLCWLQERLVARLLCCQDGCDRWKVHTGGEPVPS